MRKNIFFALNTLIICSSINAHLLQQLRRSCNEKIDDIAGRLAWTFRGIGPQPPSDEPRESLKMKVRRLSSRLLRRNTQEPEIPTQDEQPAEPFYTHAARSLSSYKADDDYSKQSDDSDFTQEPEKPIESLFTTQKERILQLCSQNGTIDIFRLSALIKKFENAYNTDPTNKQLRATISDLSLLFLRVNTQFDL